MNNKRVSKEKLAEKIEICFDKGCPNYGFCSNAAELDIEEDKAKKCLFFFLMENDIKVKDNSGRILTDEEVWDYIDAGKNQ